MGFDIECIIEIQTYPGEYFCPVCRTLVYPNEALQSQCSHLYCKPCLAHIANGSKACPYDGYLVTETDSKPLIDSDKSLVEKIGQVKVHCLYFRSGCTWEGILSDCTSHCSECSFGNSPVICNRCGIQIVHRQVHEHAQSCPGVYEAQPGIGGVPGTNSSGTVSSATANTNQSVAQSGPPLSQSQNPQNASLALQPGKNSNQQPIANPQAPLVAPVSVPTPEQWYQQQYQQYYQQCAGYDPYQQSHQQYYSIQQQPFQQNQQPFQQNQQPFQQNQQHTLHVHGQQQSYTQPQPPAPLPALPQPPTQPQLPAQAQPQPLHQPLHQPLAPFPAQPQPKSQPPLQHQLQSQSYPVPQIQQLPHFQPLAQGQAQSQPQLLPQAMSQVQVPPQGQPQLRPPIQASAPNYQVNPQQHPPLMRPQAQVPPQILPPPPNSQPTQPPLGAQGVGLPPAAQHPQVPQFQQPPLQMHPSHASQSHIQTQIHPQPQFQNQSLNQSNLQIQPQVPQYHNQFPQVRPPPSNMMLTAPAVLPQPPASSVSGQHSYQQPQSAQQMQSGAPQQNPIHQHLTSGSFHPVKVHSQVPQQPAVMRPPPSHGSFPQQQPPMFLPPQSEVPGIPPSHQQFSAHVQPPSQPPQHGTVMHPVPQAVPQQFAQQQPFHAPIKGQSHQQSHFPQQPLQPQFRPYGLPQSQQTQNYVGRNTMSHEGMHPQNSSHSSGGFGTVAHAGPAQPGSNPTPANQNLVKSTVLEKEDSLLNKHAAVQDSRLQDQGLVGKDVLGTDVEPLKEETILNNKLGPHKTGFKDIMKDEAIEDALSSEIIVAEANVCKEESHSGVDSNSLKQVDHETQKEAVVVGPSSNDFEKVPHTTVSRPETHVREHPPIAPRPPGSGMLPHSGQSLPLPDPTTNTGRAPGYFGPSPRSFESVPASQGPPPSSLADTHGIMGKVPQLRREGQSSVQNSVRPSEAATLKEQRSGPSHLYGSGEGFPLRQAYGNEATYWRTNGESEHLNAIPIEPTWPLDQPSRSLDKTLPGSSYDAGTKLNSGALDQQSRFFPPHHSSVGHDHVDVFGPGHDFRRRQMKHFSSRSPDGEYLGISPREFGDLSGFPRGTAGFEDINAREAHRFAEGSRSFNLPSDPVGEAHRFAEGSRSFNLPSDPVGNPFRDSRFPPMSGHHRRGDIDAPKNLRFGEHTPRDGLHNHMRTDEAFGQQGPGPLMRGEFSGPGYVTGHFMSEAAGPGTFPGHSHVGEFGGPGNFPHHLPFGESIRGERPSIPPFGEPGIRNSYSHQGFTIAGNFMGQVDSFDQSRKRKPISMGWCRICKFDCDTVEGLEMHSQTREHQKMAMAMVKTIKQRNKKNQRTSAGHMAHEVGTSSRKVVSNGRGNKP